MEYIVLCLFRCLYVSKASSSSNIEEEVRKSVEELESLKNEVIQSLDQAKSANKEIINEQDIKNWIQEVSSIGTIGCVAGKKKSNCVQSLICCSKQSMNLEEDVFEKKTDIANLLAQGKKFISECLTIDPPGIDIIKLGSYVEFGSRDSSLKTIISGLNDEGVRIIGLWGMGGIGKTQLVKKIGKIAQDNKLFDLVVFATLSQTPNIRNIQGAIADMLGLQLKTEDRATELRVGIANVRKILIILDDVWEKIDLENIGIPSQSNHVGCKIILTTRRLEVCNQMGSALKVCLDHLTESEALKLFRTYAGLERFDNRNNLAKRIVNQCGGLPLAIVVVGSSLRGRESVEEYEDALKKLEKSDFINVESADKEIYHVLKVSYDFLEDEETKKIFLLCSFYPEDSRINLETLTRCAFGLRLFGNVDSVSDAREKMVVSIKRLLNASLLSGIQYSRDECFMAVNIFNASVNIFNASFKSLLPDIEDHEERANNFEHKPFVTMHDVIRDVALWITKANGAPFVMPTSQELQRKCLSGNKNATACYLQLYSDSDHILQQFHYPNLKFLMIHCDEFIKYRDNFMELTTDLQVLFAGDTWTLPISLGNLNSLITLDVGYSRNLCIIGKLKNLEILQIRSRGDEDEDELPEEFRELCNLRVLDLSLWALRRMSRIPCIPCSVLSRLTRLEELYFSVDCIVDPTALKFLPRLTAFSGQFSEVNFLPNDFKFGKLQSFYINYRWNDFKAKVKFERNLELGYLDDNSVKIFEQLLPTLEYLRIKSMEGISNMVPRLDDTGFQNLRQLRLRGCKGLEYLIDNTGTTLGSQVLPNLAEIELNDMYELRKMCNGPPPPNCLGKIKVDCLNSCPMLKNVVPDLLPVGPQLERLVIRNCDGLKNVYDVPIQVFQHAKHDLPLLCPTIMELKCLKKLKSIWKLPDQLGKQELIEEEIELELCTKILEAMVSSFNSLRKMIISDCNELEEIFTPFEFNHRKYDGLLSELVELKLSDLPKLKYIWKGPQQAYSYNNLTNIHLYRCNGLTCLFTSTLAQSLEKLQCLKLVECGALETIIKLDDPFEQMSFLEIKEIHIQSCDKLESILPISLVVGERLPKLESMIIQNCAELKQVFGDGDVNVAEVGVIKMDKLQCLTLLDLPRLVRLLPENYNLNFPSLSQLIVNTWFITKLVTKHAGGLIPTEDKILQEEMPAKAQIILQPLSLRKSIWVKSNCYYEAGVFLDLGEVVEESNKSSKHIFFQQESITSTLRLPVDHPGFISFNKLQTLSIDGCPKLRSLFTLSMLRALPKLQVLKIVGCEKLEHIVVTNDEDYSNVSESACFLRLERIFIEQCYNLRSVWPLSLVEALSCLQTLQVKLAEKLEYIISDDIRKGNDCREIEVIKLPKLQNLELKGVLSLWSVTPDSYHVDCPCLRTLCFDKTRRFSSGQEEQKWHKSKRLVPIKASQLLDIKSLELNFFKVVHEVFDLEAAQQPVLEKLEVLKLHQFPDLQYIWKGPTRFIRLSNLREIEASDCGAIKSLFPHRVARTLNSLTTITVRFCKELEHIIEPGDLEDDFVSSGPVTLSNLKKIVVEDCMVLQSLFTFSIAKALWSLEEVTVCNCEKLEQIIEAGAFEEFEQIETCFAQLKKFTVSKCKNLQTVFPLSLVSALPGLKHLEINSCPMQYISKGPTRFIRLSNLRQIEASYCGAIKILFTFSIAQTLWSLKVVTIRNCEKLEHIIEPGALEDFEQVETCFPQLESLTADSCKNLQTIFPLSLASALPELFFLTISSCPMLETIFRDDIGEQRNSTSLEQIHLQKLEKLNLIALPSLKSIAPPSYHVLISSSLRDLCLLDTKDQDTDTEDEINFEYEGYTDTEDEVNIEDVVYTDTKYEVNIEDEVKVQSDLMELGTPLQGQICKKSNGILPLRVLKDADIEIENFDAEELFNLEDCKDEQIEEFSFAHLKKLRLSCLPYLKCIWKGSANSLYLWSLRRITINNCIALESSLFTHKMARTLNFLEIIEVYNCNELESIFEADHAEDHVQVGSLSCLSRLIRITVEGCEKLRTIFPLSIAQCFPWLKKVSVKRAPKLEQLFIEDRDGFAADNKEITLPDLEIIHLEELPCLIRICPTSCVLSCQKFQLLNRMAIGYCHVEVMHNLEKSIFVRNCQHFLPSFRSLSQLINFSILRHITVSDSLTLPKNLFTHYIVQRLQSLEILEIFNCKELVNIFEPANDHEAARSLPRLETLCVKGAHQLEKIFNEDNEEHEGHRIITLSAECLPKLTSLHLEGCDRLQSIFPLSVARCLPSLKKLFVKGSPKLKQIFVEDQEVCQGSDSIKLPVLENMQLVNLPCLTQVFPTGYVMICPPSARLDLKECAMREPKYLRHLHYVRVTNCSVEVLFDLEVFGEISRPIYLPLRRLSLNQLPNLACIWKGPTELICLSCLRFLRVSNCMALRNGLFSITLAQTLCLLETLEVINCKELLNLIEPPSIHPSNSSSAVINCFPRLVILHVEGCDRLRKIFPVSVTVKLPRLRKIIIKRAQLMEEIFAADSRVVGHKTLIELPELTAMHLGELPCLYSVCPAGYSLSCRPSPVNLEIRNCPSLDIIKYFPKQSVYMNSSKVAAPKIHAKWIPPPPGFVALNTAGSVISMQDSTYAGCGGLLRDTNGYWIRGFSYHVSASTDIEAELHAIKEGLKMAWCLGFEKVVLQTSSESVIQLLKGLPRHLDPLSELICYCQQYYSSIGSSWYMELKHIEGEANTAANFLAFFAFSFKSGDIRFFNWIPNDLREVIYDEESPKAKSLNFL